MHIDWFVVFVLAIAFVFAGYALWLNGKGDKPPADREDAERPASH